jgi:hypothetical protein
MLDGIVKEACGLSLVGEFNLTGKEPSLVN